MRHTDSDRSAAAYPFSQGGVDFCPDLPLPAPLAVDLKRKRRRRRQEMADLKCAAENCTYNEQAMCCKGDIMVGGKHACNCDDTCCDSFTCRREGQDAFKSSVIHPSKTISIDCEAIKCIYNTNYKCHADHVDIKGCSACDCKETACATFREK